MFIISIIWAVICFAYYPDVDNLWQEIKSNLKDAKQALDLKV
jgi:hypothetical protein